MVSRPLMSVTDTPGAALASSVAVTRGAILAPALMLLHAASRSSGTSAVCGRETVDDGEEAAEGADEVAVVLVVEWAVVGGEGDTMPLR